MVVVTESRMEMMAIVSTTILLEEVEVGVLITVAEWRLWLACGECPSLSGR